MANETTNIGLRKPVPTENFDIDRDFNANWDKLDTEIKGIKDAKDALEQEVITARGTKATLGAKLADIERDFNEQLGETANNLDEHKLEYVEQRRQDQLKVAKVEKDINDYQSTMANVNVNQEAKQSATGYGTISLPKNSANGQVSASVNGLTVTNLVKNGSFEDALLGWAGTTLTPVIDNQIKSHGQNSIRFNFANQTRRIEQEIVSNVGDILFLHQKTYIKIPSEYDNSYGRFTTSFGESSPISPLPNFDTTKLNQWQTTTLMFTSTGNNSYRIGRNTTDTTDFYVDDIVIINLTQTFGAGNEPTKEQCDKMFTNYFDGTKSTISASRLKSVGKNLESINALNTPSSDSVPILGDMIKVDSSKRIYMSQYVNGTHRYCFKAYDANKNEIIEGLTGTPYMTYTSTIGTWSRHANSSAEYVTTYLESNQGVHWIQYGFRGSNVIATDRMVSQGESQTPYEPYTESTQYLPNVGELRSLPNGVKDEIRVSGGKAEHIKRTNKYILQASDISAIDSSLINLSIVNIYKQTDHSLYGSGSRILANSQTMAIDGYTPRGGFTDNANNAYELINRFADRFSVTVPLGTTSEQAKTMLVGTALTYQLAEPIITPINVSGTLLSNPSGTVYVEHVIADAGNYTTKFDIKELQLPIKSVDKLIKYDFATGVQTVLDTSLAVISADKKSFTHPDLTKDDMVFVDYFYDVEGTLGETTIEYLDSRHTIKDSVNNKFYKWDIKSANGVPTVELTEVL